METQRNQEVFKHLVAISLTTSPEDEKLKQILKFYNLKYPEDVNVFLSGLNDAISKQKETALAEERREGGIFLSYCSKDYPKVLNLFYKLRDLGFKVWMDAKELHSGHDYKKEISEAINKAAVFVPVLSREISTHHPATDPYDENDETYHFYRDFEWDFATTK